jgi:hypothetical protein
MPAERDENGAWEERLDQLAALPRSEGMARVHHPAAGATDVDLDSRDALSPDKPPKLESSGLPANGGAGATRAGAEEERGQPGSGGGGGGSALTKDEQLRLQWNDMYERLVRYKAKYGDCVVPRSYPDDKALGNWCGNQRMMHKRGTLQGERLEKLRAVGFRFVVDERYLWGDGRNTQHLDEHWTRMCRALSEYRARRGDALVPKGYVHGSGTDGAIPLGRWVSRQRTALTQGTLPPERRAQLDALGFEWKPHASKPRGVARKRQRGSSSAPAAPAPESPPQAAMNAPGDGRSGTSSKRRKKQDALTILAYVYRHLAPAHTGRIPLFVVHASNCHLFCAVHQGPFEPAG